MKPLLAYLGSDNRKARVLEMLPERESTFRYRSRLGIDVAVPVIGDALAEVMGEGIHYRIHESIAPGVDTRKVGYEFLNAMLQPIRLDGEFAEMFNRCRAIVREAMGGTVQGFRAKETVRQAVQLASREPEWRPGDEGRTQQANRLLLHAAALAARSALRVGDVFYEGDMGAAREAAEALKAAGEAQWFLAQSHDSQQIQHEMASWYAEQLGKLCFALLRSEPTPRR